MSPQVGLAVYSEEIVDVGVSYLAEMIIWRRYLISGILISWR